MINPQDLKKNPYGVADFNDFPKRNFYYVDKTRFIRNIEEKGKFLFLIRPRRFGKTLLLSTIEAYYDFTNKNAFDYFFTGTDIHKNPTGEKNQYMILKLNFSMVNADPSKVVNSFLAYIQEIASDFVKKYEFLLNIDTNKATSELLSRETASDVLMTLLSYCKRKEQRIYVIIDEYDNFANTILADSGEKNYIAITRGEGFLRSFFNVLKGGTSDANSPISRLFMTGVSPITLDDVTSGFNIAMNISLHSDVNEILGFTYGEVETMIDYYRQTGKIKHSNAELIEIMSQWYNHYRFSPRSSSEIFNTSQVLYFLNEYMIDSAIPINLVDTNARTDYNKLRQLIIIDKQGKPETNGNFSKLQQIMETDTVTTTIQSSFPVKLMGNPENFYSLLFYFGLLTLTGMTPSQRAILSIPNEFTRKLYYDYIQSIYKDIDLFKIDADVFSNLMDEMAFKGNWEPAIGYIAGRMEASLGIRDLIDREKALQVFWNVYLGLNSLYIVYPEKELSHGFADLALIPLLTQYPGITHSYLIEFKYIKPSHYKRDDGENKVRMLRNEAEVQLNQYSMDERFKKHIGSTSLKKLILIFSGNRMVHQEEI
ncbi:MAG: AAA family ATPase [Candidatus Omnitrophota bacterium]